MGDRRQRMLTTVAKGASDAVRRYITPGLTARPSGDGFPVPPRSQKSPGARVLKIRVVEYHERNTVLGQHRTTIPVVSLSLLASPDPRERGASIEERHGTGVLPLVILDHQPDGRVERVHGKRLSAPRDAWITDQEWEATLAQRRLSQDLVAQPDDPILITTARRVLARLPSVLSGFRRSDAGR